jgi:hypothetical protein
MTTSTFQESAVSETVSIEDIVDNAIDAKLAQEDDTIDWEAAAEAEEAMNLYEHGVLAF